MNKKERIGNKKKIFTIPNLLSLFRLCLIPVCAWLYCVKDDCLTTTILLIVSAVTDVLDGFIARRFNMVSDLGKILDPIADKLTQIVMILCLVSNFRYMLIPLILLTVKEILAAVTGFLTIRKTNKVMSALWHGKLTTLLLYTMMVLHIIWLNIPATVSKLSVAACTAMMLLSCVLYSIRNIRILLDRNDARS